MLFMGKDWIFSKISFFWSPPGYDSAKVDKLLGKGDSFLVPQGKTLFQGFKEFLSADSEPPLPPLDMQLMEEACVYFENKNHKDPFLDYPSWHRKKDFLKNHLNGEELELILTFEPGYYWKEKIEYVLQALDYYKRALNFSGPEIRVPRRIEKAALASCRYAEILLAYTTHIYATESYVEKAYLADLLSNTDFLKKPSWFKRIWNWMRGRKEKNKEMPTVSRLTPKQIQLRIWDMIRNNQIREIKRSEFIESLQKTLNNRGAPLTLSSPREALEVYERLLFFVSNQNSPIEYRRYRKDRAGIYLDLAKEDEIYFQNAIREYQDASELPNPENLPGEIFPALLVESFSLELGIAKVHFERRNFSACLNHLTKMENKLRNLDERSIGGIGLDIEKKSLLKEYREMKKISLRKLGRFEEADEIP
jgi:hypothetical protein